MPLPQDLTVMVDRLCTQAMEEYHSTPYYELLSEKITKIKDDCDMMLMEDQKSFALECFETIQGIDRQESLHLYHRAFHDCIAALRHLGVLQ